MDTIIAFLAQYFYLVVLAIGIVFLLVGYRSRLVEWLIAAIVIGGTSYLLSKLGNSLIASPRPFIVTGHPALILSATDNGFPSDHTLLLAVLAAVITLVNWRAGLVFWVLTLVVGFARIYVGVHHLLDVVGSLLIVGIATAIYLLARYVWKGRWGTSRLR